MALAVLLIATLLFVELFVRLKIIRLATQPALLAQRSVKLIQSERISDHWKERALPAYSQRMFASTFRLLGALLIAFSPFAIAIVLTPYIDVPVWAELTSLRGIVFSTVVAFAYLFVRGRFVGK